MHYRFLQAAHVGGRDYSRGVHEVTEKAESDPYFLKLVGAGLVVEADSPVKTAPLESPQDRVKRLHDRLVKQADVKKAAKAPASAVTPETKDTDSDDEKSSKEKKSFTDKHHEKKR